MWGWVKKVKSRDIKELNQFVYISNFDSFFHSISQDLILISYQGLDQVLNSIFHLVTSLALICKKGRSLKRCVLLLIIENLRPNKPLNKHFMNDQNTKYFLWIKKMYEMLKSFVWIALESHNQKNVGTPSRPIHTMMLQYLWVFVHLSVCSDVYSVPWSSVAVSFKAKLYISSTKNIWKKVLTKAIWADKKMGWCLAD